MQPNLFSKDLISFRTSSAFVIASMIGTGVFTSLGYQLLDITSIFPLLMLWFVGGILSLFGAFTYGELGSALPQSGGEYRLLSIILHPSIGFSAGIVSATVGFTAPAVLAALALGNYLKAIFSDINASYVAIIVIVLIHLIHMSSLNAGKKFQDISTLLKIILITAFIFFGFLSNNSQNISIFPKTGDISILFSPNFAVSLVWVSYSYSGWNSVIYFVSEVQNPSKNVTKIMLFSIIFVMIIYLLLNYIFLLATPIEDMVGKVEIGYLAGVAIFGKIGATIVSIGISILLLSTISSYVFIGPRIIKAMGEDNSIISFFSYENSKNIPITAFIFQLALSLLLLFTSSFNQVLVYAGVTLILVTILTVVSLFVLRIKKPRLHRPYKTWGYPFTPMVFLIINIWILYYSLDNVFYETIIGFSIILLSTFLYFFLSKFNKSDYKKTNIT